jgi:uncharacterized damage-inducible protein DinB
MLFIVGHVIATRGMVLRLLGASWSAPWESLFGRGAPLAERDQYPSVKEILAAWDDVCRRVPEALQSATTETLSSAPPPDLPTFDGKLGGVIAFLGFHEAYHVGQVAYLRRWLGHGPLG